MHTKISTRMVIALSGDRLNKQACRLDELEGIQKGLSLKAKLLTRSLNNSGAVHDEDLVWVPGGLETPIDHGESNNEWIRKQRKHQRVWRRMRRMSEHMPNDAQKSIQAHMEKIGMVCRYEVEESLEKIQSKVRAISAAYKRIVADFKKMLNEYNSTQQSPALLSA